MTYSYIVAGYLYFVFLIILYKQKSKNIISLEFNNASILYNKEKILNFSRNFDGKVFHQNINVGVLLGVFEVNLIFKNKCYSVKFDRVNRRTLVSKVEIESQKIYIKIISFASNIKFLISNIKEIKPLVSINILVKNKCFQVDKKLRKISITNNKTTTITSSSKITRARMFYKKNINKLNILLNINNSTNITVIDIINTISGNNYKTIDNIYKVVDKNKTIDICISKLNFTTKKFNINYSSLKDKAISEFKAQEKYLNFSEYLNSFDLNIFNNFSLIYIKNYCFSKKQFCLFLKFYLTRILGVQLKPNGINFLKIKSQLSFDIITKKEIISIKRNFYNIDFIRNKILFRNMSFLRI